MNQKQFRIVIKKKDDKLYIKWNGYNNSLNSWIDKKRHSINRWIFSNISNSLGTNVKVEADLSNYATKIDLKNATGVNISSFAKKIYLANLISDVNNLDIDQLKEYQVV